MVIKILSMYILIYSTVTDLAKFLGLSMSQFFNKATWYARSWTGIVRSIGESKYPMDGSLTPNLMFSFNNSFLWSVINKIFPPLAITSWVFESVFSKNLSLGAITITGNPSYIRAKGPCFISPAG